VFVSHTSVLCQLSGVTDRCQPCRGTGLCQLWLVTSVVSASPDITLAEVLQPGQGSGSLVHSSAVGSVYPWHPVTYYGRLAYLHLAASFAGMELSPPSFLANIISG
jgi:hypothetical protein